MYDRLIMSFIWKYRRVDKQLVIVGDGASKSLSRSITKSTAANDVIRLHRNWIFQRSASGTVIFRKSSYVVDFSKDATGLGDNER